MGDIGEILDKYKFKRVYKNLLSYKEIGNKCLIISGDFKTEHKGDVFWVNKVYLIDKKQSTIDDLDNMIIPFDINNYLVDKADTNADLEQIIINEIKKQNIKNLFNE